MPRQKSYQSSEKGRRNHNPNYDHSYSREGLQISQAETSVEFDRERDRWDNSKEDRKHSDYRSSSKKHHHHSKQKGHHRTRSPKRNPRRSRSFEAPNNSSLELSKSWGSSGQQKMKRFCSIKRDEDEIRQVSITDVSRAGKVDEYAKIMDEIQRFDYKRLDYQELRDKFIRISGKHLNYNGLFPEAFTSTGTQFLKDGLFHEMWSLAFLKSKQASKEPMLQTYYALFQPIIDKNLSNFEKTFNPIPEEEKSFNYEFSQRKRDYINHDESTRSTTKVNVMLLYEQVRGDIRVAEIQENLVQKFEKSIEDLRLKVDQSIIQETKNSSDINFDDDKAIANWTEKGEDKKRETSIEKIKKSKLKERSPLSNRFRMMHEVQSNGRRMAAEMACVFLKLNVFYFFNDLHIVKVDEVIMSENQSIVVVKAFTVDFCPLMNKMKIEPKVKNLISVYKFSNLQELIRLENTHGKFDGIIVYPESFNVQKYLTSSDEISLLKNECVQHIKEQIFGQNVEY